METVHLMGIAETDAAQGVTLAHTTFLAFYTAMPASIQMRFRAATRRADERLKAIDYPGTMPSATLKTATTGAASERRVLPELPLVFKNIIIQFLPKNTPGKYRGHWSDMVFAEVIAFWQSVVEPFESMDADMDAHSLQQAA